MSKVDALEAKYYPPVLEYLAQERKCRTYSYERSGEKFLFIGRGQGQLIVDCYGLYGGSDTRTRRIEGFAVEVKRSTKHTSLRYIHQARQYSALAQRCYLAQPASFSDEVKIAAAREGIGLLQIKGKGVELVAESRYFEPNPLAMALFMNNSLAISQCGVCGCYQFRYFDPFAGKRTGLGHWRRDHIARPPRGTFNKLMFLCRECEEYWESAGEAKSLAKRLVTLEKRVMKLSAQLKKLKAKE